MTFFFFYHFDYITCCFGKQSQLSEMFWVLFYRSTVNTNTLPTPLADSAITELN